MKAKSIFFLVFSFLLAAACDSNAHGAGTAADNARVQNRGAGKDNWWDAQPRPEWAQFERITQPQDWFEVYRVSEGAVAR